MGFFSTKSSSGSGRKISKPSINGSQSSIISTSSSVQTPVLGMMSSTFPPTTSAPVHNPKVPLPRAPDPRVDPVAYLRSIGAVRERCSLILEKAKSNELNHFNVDMSKFEDTIKFVVSIIKVPHYVSEGRFAHANLTSARLCARLLSYTSSRQMAAF
jgi:hypothetical protein